MIIDFWIQLLFLIQVWNEQLYFDSFVNPGPFFLYPYFLPQIRLEFPSKLILRVKGQIFGNDWNWKMSGNRIQTYEIYKIAANEIQSVFWNSHLEHSNLPQSNFLDWGVVFGFVEFFDSHDGIGFAISRFENCTVAAFPYSRKFFIFFLRHGRVRRWNWTIFASLRERRRFARFIYRPEFKFKFNYFLKFI